jgi:hypothetical protein
MSRVDIADRLHDVIERSEQFKKQLTAIRSGYFKEGMIRFTTETDDWHNKGIDDYGNIEFSPHVMEEYLRSEIDYLEEEATRLLDRLR